MSNDNTGIETRVAELEKRCETLTTVVLTIAKAFAPLEPRALLNALGIAALANKEALDNLTVRVKACEAVIEPPKSKVVPIAQ